MDSSSNMWGSPDEAMARVAQQVQEAQERAARASEVRAEMDALRGVATSPKREVEATADTSGRLVGLVLSGDALELHESDLAQLILATAAQAAARAGALAVDLAAEAFGAESAITSRFRDEISERNETANPTGSDISYR